MFSWVPSLVLGQRDKNMNLERENEDRKYERRLTVQANERTSMKLVTGTVTSEE